MNKVVSAVTHSAIQLVLFPAEQFKDTLENLWAKVISDEPPAKVEKRPAAATEVAEGVIENNQVVLATGPLRVELKVSPGLPQTPEAFLSIDGTADLSTLERPVMKFAPKLIEALGPILRVGYVVTSQKTYQDQTSANKELLQKVKWDLDPDTHSDMNVQFNERGSKKVGGVDFTANILKRFQVMQVQTGFIAMGQVPSGVPIPLGGISWIVQSMVDSNNVQSERRFEGDAALELISALADNARIAWD